MIRRKIGVLTEKLGHVAEHRARLRDRSRERRVVKVALVGYTNAGKSSLLKALTRADAHVEDRLFATLDTASREIPVEGRLLRFTDTVGFIRKLPHDLVASFRATLEEAEAADVIVHVVDVSHPAWEQQAAVVSEALEQVGVDGVTRSLVVALNKADLLSREEREERLGIARAWGWEAELVSAVRGFGLEALGTRIVGFSRRPQSHAV
jgi:GTP-binding protein HflX